MRLRFFERKIVRKIFGPIQIGKDIWRIRNNAELDQVINGTDILRFIKAQRMKWLGLIQIMDTSRIAKRILEWKPIGSRSLGRPRL
jgi:ribosomal protein S28E/S33